MPDVIERLRASLGDRYQIERHLGAGGMATVYLAEDVRHGRQVAVKVVRPELAEAWGAERFTREIRVTAGLTHPNIPPLLDSGVADGLLYYVLPYLHGATLGDRLRQEGRLGVEETLQIGRELADALGYAHRIGVVHRDVKPSNVFLEEGHALIGDFGVALAPQAAGTARITTTEMVLGTAEYMSPEQCTGSHAVDARTDIYSLGCLLYEALAGEPPFVGRTRVAVVARQIGELPPPLTLMRGDVPPYVAAILERCLAKAPADRYPTAEALRDDLDVALRKVRGVEPAPAGATRGWRAWLGVAAVMVVAGFGIMLVRPKPAPAVSANRVMGFPLADRGGGAEVGGDLALLVGNALLHTDPLMWADGWEVLTPAGRGDPSQVTLRRARALALARGARHFITGAVVRAGDTLTVRLGLHDALGDSLVGQAAASGHVQGDPLERLALRAVVGLLPSLLDPGRRVDVSAIADRDPGGVALWIQGDREYRMGRFAAALELYRRAVEADSFLVYAAMKGAQSASWRERLDVAEDLLSLAIRHDTLLPPRHQAYLRGLSAYQEGAADSATAALGRALAFDPDWVEAWTQLGEVHQHLLPTGTVPGDSARHAFQQALRRDSAFVPAMVHLAEYAVRDGDMDRARALHGRVTASGADEDVGEWLGFMLECVGAPDPRMGFTFPRPAAEVVLYASAQLAVGLRHPACAEAGFRDVLGRENATAAERWGALLGMYGLLAAQNRTPELEALLAEELSAGLGSVRFVYLLAPSAGVPLQARAREVDEEAAGRWAPTYEGTGALTLWALVVWNVREGDLSTARTQVARLDDAARTQGDTRTVLLAAAARAHLTLAEGDTAQALEAFRALKPGLPRSDLQYGLAEGLAVERIRLAELLLARGEWAEAYRAASLTDHPQPVLNLQFVPRSLAIRAQAADRMRGREWSTRAREARARLEALGRLDELDRVGVAGR